MSTKSFKTVLNLSKTLEISDVESAERLKSLLSSLYKREEFPLFGKEGIGEIFAAMCLFNYGFLSGA